MCPGHATGVASSGPAHRSCSHVMKAFRKVVTGYAKQGIGQILVHSHQHLFSHRWSTSPLSKNRSGSALRRTYPDWTSPGTSQKGFASGLPRRRSTPQKNAWISGSRWFVKKGQKNWARRFRRVSTGKRTSWPSVACCPLASLMALSRAKRIGRRRSCDKDMATASSAIDVCAS